jgi:hypothetical protein
MANTNVVSESTVNDTRNILQLITSDVKEIASGPDGNQFIIALQKFMTSFLHSQRGPVGGVEVDLNGAYESFWCGTYVDKSELKPKLEISVIPVDYDEDSSEPESIFNADPPASSPSHNAHSSIYVINSESKRSQDQEGVDPKNSMYKTFRLTSSRNK